MENELTVYESHPLTANDIRTQVGLIQDVMKSVMKDGEHYGKIPGCGDKPALLKPGAEKLNLTFRMAPDFEIETIDLGRGHREYRIKCSLKSIATGKFLGMGVGSASTMEGKWRFRNAEPEMTEKFIPKEYWEMRKKEPEKAMELIGGKGYAPKKVDGNWYIAKLTGEKVEHDNPADYYNTCLKMAKKRAHVDAVLTVTAASDIFTQDIDELAENGGHVETEHEEKPATEAHPPPQTPSPQQEASKGGVITEPQRKRLYAMAKATGASDEKIKNWLKEFWNIEHTRDISRDQYEEICKLEGLQ